MSDKFGLKWILRRPYCHEKHDRVVERQRLQVSAIKFRDATTKLRRSSEAESENFVHNLRPIISDLMQRKKHCNLLQRWLMTVVCLLNDRITFVWNIRETSATTHGTCRRMREASLVYSYIKDTFLLLDNVRNSSFVNDSTEEMNHLEGVVSPILSALKGRLERCVAYHAQQAAIEQSRKILKQNPRLFYTVSTIVPAKMLAKLGRWFTRRGSSGDNSTGKHSELEIAASLKTHAVDSVYQSFVQREPGQKETAALVAGIAINAVVHGLLHAIVANNEPFDEMGVYRLYRVLLRLHEVVGEVKTELQMQPSQKVVQDAKQWRIAEAIVQTLNRAVFAQQAIASSGREGGFITTGGPAIAEGGVGRVEDRRGGDCSGGGGGALSLSELQRWQDLVHPPKQSMLLPRRSRRHKGTVFTTLTFDLDSL